ncbi:hypothetical protein DFH29DRAFT_882014 [Suillus ampliporus]|nr:hypothetical protein DFH29DRAFT_882014 [Suillus ampliporus]
MRGPPKRLLDLKVSIWLTQNRNIPEQFVEGYFKASPLNPCSCSLQGPKGLTPISDLIKNKYTQIIRLKTIAEVQTNVMVSGLQTSKGSPTDEIVAKRGVERIQTIELEEIGDNELDGTNCRTRRKIDGKG